MTKTEKQKLTRFLIRIESKLARIESRQGTLNKLFTLHLGDAEHVSELQRKLNGANEKIRELETELYFERKVRGQ